MFDEHTIRICKHMLEHSPDFDPDLVAYHSIEHDIIQSKTAQVMSDYCKRKSLYQKIKGVVIWNGAGLPVFWKSLQGHPKVTARRKRNKERNASAYRMARKFVSVESHQMIEKQKSDSRTEHWFNRKVA